MDKVTPSDIAGTLTEFWSQQVVGSANGNLFKVAKGIGSTNWHTHEDQEETFYILDGELTIQLRNGDVRLSAGDLLIIPRGVEHCPLANEEARFMLIGPDVTSNAAGGKPAWSYQRDGQGGLVPGSADR
jgi:quercetin dioxygenase-like cupin family protein